MTSQPSQSRPSGPSGPSRSGPSRPLDVLNRVCAGVRPGAEADTVDGIVPACVAVPATVEEAAAAMRVAAEHGLRVVARGGGTKLGWGRPPEACDLVLDTGALNQVIEHAAGDLVVTVRAGRTLDALQEVLADHGQQLALDSVLPGATIGGTLATATSGPRRLLYGTARDLLIGITIVRADGAVAKAGGKVVKNVAGYDLGKLLTGSYGTLGVIVGAAFRLHPLPAASAYVTATTGDPRDAVTLVRALLHSPFVPAAVELDRTGPGEAITITASIEGVAAGTAARAAGIGRLLGADAVVSERPPDWWGGYPGSTDGILIQVSVPPERVAAVLETPPPAGPDGARAVEDRGGERPDARDLMGPMPGMHIRGSAATGVLYLALPAGTSPESAAGFLTRLRERLGPGGSAVVLRAPREIRESVDLWGAVPGLTLMRRIKDQFDPARLLAPGRFVGGI